MLVLASVLVLGPSAGAALDPTTAHIEPLVLTLRSTIARYRAHERETAAIKSESDSLSKRIAARRKEIDARGLGQDRMLADLLRTSLGVSNRWADATRKMDAVQTEIARQKRATISAIDGEIQKLRSALYVPEQQVEAARAIKAWLAIRRDVEVLTNGLGVAPASTSVRKWADYEAELRIGPEDDATTLREKAAYIEDLREKFKKRQALLKERSAELSAEREVLRAAHDFQATADMFDETSRSTRVLRNEARRGAKGGSSAVVLDVPSETNSPPSSGQESPGVNFDATATGQGGRSYDDAPSKARTGVQGVGVGNALRLETGRPVNPSAVVAIDLAALSKEEDPALVDAWISELEGLDALLAEKRMAIEARAYALESNEAKNGTP